MTRHIRALAFVCAVVGAATSASAQAPSSAPGGADGDPSESARFRLGVLRFTPALSVNNVGIDTNVFNSATEPRSDTTAAVGPVVNLWLKTGPARLSAQVGAQYLYFKTYDNQRAWNSADSGRYEFTRGIIRPFVTGTYANNKDRPGFEIDSRIRQTQRGWSAGTTVLLGGHSNLMLEGGRSSIRFDDRANHFGVNVANTLDRHVDVERAQFRNVLTPLTTWVLSAELFQDRFSTELERNANSVRVTTGFELRPAALISGQVLVGYRRLNLLAAGAPDFNGLTASGSVSLVIHGATRLTLSELRDTNYSYDQRFPFYVLTSTTVQLQHQLGPTWDLVGRGALNNLSYALAEKAAELEGQAPTDRLVRAGAGFGYRVGRQLRVGFDADYYTRRAESGVSAQFGGLRAGLSLSYGLPK